MTTDRFANRDAVRLKIEWEGGVFEALDYGLNASDMPEGDQELMNAWSDLEVAWNAMQPLIIRVDMLIYGEAND